MRAAKKRNGTGRFLEMILASDSDRHQDFLMRRSSPLRIFARLLATRKRRGDRQAAVRQTQARFSGLA
jgi:hypothetical protein